MYCYLLNKLESSDGEICFHVTLNVLFQCSFLLMVSAGVLILVSSLGSSDHLFLCDFFFFMYLLSGLFHYKSWMINFLNLCHLPYDGSLIFSVVGVVFSMSLP